MKTYFDFHHFLRYVANDWIAKVEYLKDGFADIEYFELSERYRFKKDRNLAFSIGAVHRLAEPYGYDPLEEWILDNGNLHYTYLAIQEGYTIDVANSEYKDPNGNIVANSVEVWKEIVIPQVLFDYTEKKKSELKSMYESPEIILSKDKIGRWGIIQVVKLFLGIPIVPGR